jgi:hypothetical protein
MSLNQEPLAVLVTWFDEFPLAISFKEEWSHNTNGMLKATNEISDQLANKSSDAISKTDGSTDDISNPFLSSLWSTFLSAIDTNDYSDDIYSKILGGANPNLIKESVYRKPASLKSSITIDLTFEYVLRYIDGIDPHIAMHNIIANIIRMGTSTSISIYPKLSNDSKFKEIYTDISQGKIIKVLKKILSSAKNFLTGNNDTDSANSNKQITLNSVVKNITNSLSSGEKIGEVFENYSSKVMSVFRFKLIAALQAETSAASGQWHVTIGNPFNPIATVGDLIISDNINLKFNKELSYNDFPTEVYATIKLKSARTRGAQEIEQIFNNGFGRIYVYPTESANPDYFNSEPSFGVCNKPKSNYNNNMSSAITALNTKNNIPSSYKLKLK